MRSELSITMATAIGASWLPSEVARVLTKFRSVEEFDEKAVSNSMRNNRDIAIVLSFGDGNAGIRFWTTDLTEEYVRLNADYRT